MASILITGNTRLFTRECLELLAEEYKIVITGDFKMAGNIKNVHIYHTNPMEEKFSQLFDVYSFRAIWYVSGYADGGEELFGESQWLERIMMECRRSRVDKLIMLSTVDSQNFLPRIGRNGEITGRDYSSSRAFRASQNEEIVRHFSEKAEVTAIILWLPYLAFRVNDENFLGRIFHIIYNEEKLSFPYHREDRVDFLSFRDLAELLCQITEETEDDTVSCFVTSGYQYTYGDLEAMLKIISPKLQVTYKNIPDTVEWPLEETKVRRIYGFVPEDNIMDSIGSNYRIFVREVMNGRKTLSERIRERVEKSGKGVFVYLEVLLVFLLGEWISRYTSESIYFKFVDVRLLYIVIMGSMHGLKAGMAAALLECLVLIKKYAALGVGWIVLFYNIENWLSFSVYLMAGIITGYIRNKNTDEIAFTKKEYALLREKYLFLNDVYHGAIENKGEYKKQILGFKDSFGKIFEAVQKLDNELPESIFLEGLRIMEDILENHSIAIYTLDEWRKYGRLAVCSNSQIHRLAKSIRLDEFQEMFQEIEKGNVWKNTGLQKGVPMYACGVFRGDSMVLLVAVWEADMEQYNMQYMNILRILCGLVQTSFLRAMEHEELMGERNYYPHTHVVYPERFRRLLQVQEDMKEAGVADYVLVRFKERDMAVLSEMVNGMVRASDTLGADEDGNLYLLLVQMNRNHFRVMGERLEGKGIVYELVEKAG